MNKNDPVCLIHGKRWSEHEGGRCLYCCLCFKALTPEECHVLPDGTREDVCNECADLEAQFRGPKCGCDYEVLPGGIYPERRYFHAPDCPFAENIIDETATRPDDDLLAPSQEDADGLTASGTSSGSVADSLKKEKEKDGR